MDQAYGKTFAQVYNKKWTAFATAIAPKIEAVLQSGPAFSRLPRTLVDICCGTGQLAGYFLSKGYVVHGIDLSPHQLALAHDNNRQHVSSGTATFSVQDASRFRLTGAVSYAVCLFDSVNHLDSTQSVHACFHRVHDALAPGGRFVFDVNTKKGLHRWNGMSVQEDEEVFILNRGLFDDEMDRAYTMITGFLRDPDGRYQRFNQTAFNLVLPVDGLLGALEATGFRDSYCAGSGDLTVAVDDPEDLGRVFIVSNKG